MATQMNLGEKVDLEEVKKEIEEHRAATSRFVKIEDGELAELEFTGVAYKGINSYGNAVMSFELAEKNASGENKVWSVGANNTIVQELIGEMLEGNLRHTISRSGTGTETRYSRIKNKK